MNLERQKRILKARHDLGLLRHDYFTRGPVRLVVNESIGAALVATGNTVPRYSCWAWETAWSKGVVVWSPANVEGFRQRKLHNFVAAVTYAKAELARLEAAKETR